MDFYCQSICSFTDDHILEVLVEKSLENREQFELISYFVYAVKHPDFYGIFKESFRMMGNLSKEFEVILDNFFYTDIETLKDRRGSYVELLIYNGLHSTKALSRERECVPYLNKQKVEVYYQEKLLDKNFDVGFWNLPLVELYECKADLKTFIKNQDKFDKLVYLNEIWFKLKEKGIDVSVFIGDLSLASDVKGFPFPPAPNRPFHEVLKECIKNIFRFLNYPKEVKISFFNRTTLSNNFFE